MDQRATGISTDNGRREDATPRVTAEELGGEIVVVRGELDTLLGELDRRRHDALDLPLQLRRHARGASLSVLALVITAAASVWLRGRRRQRRERLGAQAGRLRLALGRMTEHPERVAAEPTVVEKIFTAAASAAMAALVKKVLEGALERIMQATAEPPAVPPRRSEERPSFVHRRAS